ncbi:ABC transporter permease [Phaeovibrio sulfidiphilus]|uniref:ABC transporter permease n=1 Tax=Phaeovibrio sulfidiphilus TaxID=1220600 RepID=A0A8J7CBU8_9PROT|nr:ABC transporter permease [Phaeovibrio sulfidiphilus]MBE1236558.1 ABC transporter permease [Phaeovibrio sulfidiphilus]
MTSHRILPRLSLSPLTRRRLQVFRANRRAWWSFWIFLVLFVVSLFAEFIANERPLLVRYEGSWYVPVLVDYPDKAFGGFLEGNAVYTDPYTVDEIESKGWILWPPIRFSHLTTVDNVFPVPAPPSTQNWLGVDDSGNDVLAKLIYGFRLSVLFGLGLCTVSSVVGILVGAVQGYFGGLVDLIGQRLLEIWSGMPSLYVLIILMSLFVPTVGLLFLIMLLFSWTALVGLVRAEVLRARNFEYVRAARALGVGDMTILVRHILPNAMVATLTFAPFLLTGSISTLAALDLLGLGLPVTEPSLGRLLMAGKNNLNAPWLGLTAFLVIAITLTLLVFVGEGVRDAFNPRKGGSR